MSRLGRIVRWIVFFNLAIFFLQQEAKVLGALGRMRKMKMALT